MHYCRENELSDIVHVKCPALCLHRRGSASCLWAVVAWEQWHLSSVLCSWGLRSKNRHTAWSRVQSADRTREKCSFPTEMTSGYYGNTSRETMSPRRMENTEFRRGCKEGSSPWDRKAGVALIVGVVLRAKLGVLMDLFVKSD